MVCPECKAPNTDGAVACGRCGLLLFSVAPPKRRREDFSVQRRRAADQEPAAATCPFCRGEVPAEAIRCLHCGQIINAGYRMERNRRRRAYVNYASWMSYLFGLVAFVIFRPVGILAISVGLLLSIVYYSIPVEGEFDPSRRSGWQNVKHFLRSLVRLERVSVPIPHLPKVRFIFVGTPLLAAFVGLLANFFILQRPMNQLLSENDAYRGMSVSAHYLYWMVPGVVVYDLRAVPANGSRLDVHTALVEYARRMRTRDFREVELMYRGVKKFSIDGAEFRKLGNEYERHNYRFALIDFPRAVSAQFERESGEDGRLALIDFHDRWYGSDVMKQSIRSAPSPAGGPPPPAPSPARSNS